MIILLSLVAFEHEDMAWPTWVSNVICHPLSSQETAILLVGTKDQKSAIHRLFVKSGKSDWLKMQNEYSEHAQKIGSGQRS